MREDRGWVSLPVLQAGLALLSAVVVLACWPFGQAWLVFLGVGVVGAGGAVVVLLAPRSTAPLGWSLLGAGVLAYALSATLLVLSGTALPVSVANGVGVAGYCLDVCGLILLLRREAPVFRTTPLLDSLVAVLGVTAVAAVALDPVVEQSGGLAAALILIAFPAGDLVVLCVALGALAVLGWPWRSSWGWLAGGFAWFMVFDVGYLLSAITGTFSGSLLVNTLWPFGSVLIAFGAARADRRRRREQGGRFLWVLPGAVTLAGVGMLAAPLLGRQVPATASWLAVASLLAVFARMALTYREIAELAETRRQAHHDDLTELPNRRRLSTRLEEELGGDAGEPRLALLLLDLNRFKEVNDALGHGVGDELLVELAARLQDELADVVASGGLLARLGGDEFAVLLPRGGGPDAEDVAARIAVALRRPFALDDVTLHVDASIGIALCPDHASERIALMRCADVAMYEAKRSRSGFSVYVTTSHTNNRARLQALDELRRGLAAGEVVCHFQPKADLSSGRIVGAEALARWQHPERGLLTPDAFMPLIEQAGLMGRLTGVVLDGALRACRTWQDAGQDLTVAVNLSPTSLLSSDLPDQVAAALRRHGLRGDRLRLEITEDVLMADPRRAAQMIELLRATGIGISLDDYGTGYSSLSYLHELVLDELKLDRSYITGIGARPRDVAIVTSTIVLAHALDLIVVAEGVETHEDRDFLTRLGCDQMQGYLLSRPVPADEILRLVGAAGSRPARTR